MDGLSRNILLDAFVHIPVPVTDFCDTGITDKDVAFDDRRDFSHPISRNAMPLGILRSHVERILHGRPLVGYKVEDSLKALGLAHPWINVRDIAFFPPFLNFFPLAPFIFHVANSFPRTIIFCKTSAPGIFLA